MRPYLLCPARTFPRAFTKAFAFYQSDDKALHCKQPTKHGKMKENVTLYNSFVEGL